MMMNSFVDYSVNVVLLLMTLVVMTTTTTKVAAAATPDIKCSTTACSSPGPEEGSMDCYVPVGTGEEMTCIDEGIYKFPVEISTFEWENGIYLTEYTCCDEAPPCSTTACSSPGQEEGSTDCYIPVGTGEETTCSDEVYKFPVEISTFQWENGIYLTEYTCCDEAPQPEKCSTKACSSPGMVDGSTDCIHFLYDDDEVATCNDEVYKFPVEISTYLLGGVYLTEYTCCDETPPPEKCSTTACSSPGPEGSGSTDCYVPVGSGEETTCSDDDEIYKFPFIVSTFEWENGIYLTEYTCCEYEILPSPEQEEEEEEEEEVLLTSPIECSDDACSSSGGEGGAEEGSTDCIVLLGWLGEDTTCSDDPSNIYRFPIIVSTFDYPSVTGEVIPLTQYTCCTNVAPGVVLQPAPSPPTEVVIVPPPPPSSDDDNNTTMITTLMKERQKFCDETKCTSPGFLGMGEFDCWSIMYNGDGDDIPTDDDSITSCREGYEGRLVADVPQMQTNTGIVYGYYTCCKPEYTPTTGVDIVIPDDGDGDDNNNALMTVTGGQLCDDSACSSPFGTGDDVVVSACFTFADSIDDPKRCYSETYSVPKDVIRIEWELRKVLIQYTCCKQPLFLEEEEEEDGNNNNELPVPPPPSNVVDDKNIIWLCDESKCNSPGMTNTFGYKDCWTLLNDIDPMLCIDDDYVGRLVEGVTPLHHPGYFAGGDYKIYHYYTCCPRDVLVNNNDDEEDSSIISGGSSSSITIPGTDDNDIGRVCSETACVSYGTAEYPRDCHVNVDAEEVMVCDENSIFTIPTPFTTYEWATPSATLLVQQYTCCRMKPNSTDNYLGDQETTQALAPNQYGYDDFGNARCDESKCRNWGRQIDRYLEHVCWARENVDNLNCVDGYEGRLVDGVDPLIQGDTTYLYYTCCPIINEEVTDVSYNERDCSFDACNSYSVSAGAGEREGCVVVAQDFSGGRIGDETPYGLEAHVPTCDEDGIYRYPREMSTIRHYENGLYYMQYTCCRTYLWYPEADGGNKCTYAGCGTASAGDTFDCTVLTESGYGFGVDAMTCFDDRFKFPRVVESSDILTVYTCCEENDGTVQGGYIRNDAFWATVLPQLIVSSLVFVGLVILITGILSSSESRAVAFNIYLVALELADTILNGTLVVVVTMYIVQNAESSIFWALAETVVMFSTVANMWLNSIVCYQILRLLQGSRGCVRIPPPSVRRVLIESVAVYTLAFAIACLFLVAYLLDSKGLDIISLGSAILGSVVPTTYVFYVSIRIWMQKLLPLTGETRGMVIYFGRIVFVFFALYLPGTIFFLLGLQARNTCSAALEEGIHKVDECKAQANYGQWTRSVGLLLYSMQGAVSLIVALQKSDVRKAVVMLLSKCCCFIKEGETERSKTEGSTKLTASARSSSMRFWFPILSRMSDMSRRTKKNDLSDRDLSHTGDLSNRPSSKFFPGGKTQKSILFDVNNDDEMSRDLSNLDLTNTGDSSNMASSMPFPGKTQESIPIDVNDDEATEQEHREQQQEKESTSSIPLQMQMDDSFKINHQQTEGCFDNNIDVTSSTPLWSTCQESEVVDA